MCKVPSIAIIASLTTVTIFGLTCFTIVQFGAAGRSLDLDFEAGFERLRIRTIINNGREAE